MSMKGNLTTRTLMALVAAVTLSWAAPPPPPPPTYAVAPIDDDAGAVLFSLKMDGGGVVRELSVASAFGAGGRRCAELCRAGFGGLPCGSSCDGLLPDEFSELSRKPYKLTTLLKNVCNKTTTPSTHDSTDTDEGGMIGIPRYGVCQDLCKNNLGNPICGCANKKQNSTADWSTVCSAFCKNGSYRLDGCPSCPKITMAPYTKLKPWKNQTAYAVNQDVWVEWCNYQCLSGNGGAACNCDLAPLML